MPRTTFVATLHRTGLSDPAYHQDVLTVTTPSKVRGFAGTRLRKAGVYITLGAV